MDDDEVRGNQAASSGAASPDPKKQPNPLRPGVNSWEDVEKLLRSMAPINIGIESARFLFEEASRAPGLGEIVEIGSNIGMSAITLGAAQKLKNGKPIHSIDIWEHPQFKSNLALAGVTEYVSASVESSAVAAKRWTLPIELLFIDGDHSYDGVATDIKLWGRHVVEGGILVLDDYPGHMGSSEVWRAVHHRLFSDPFTWRIVSDRANGSFIVFQRVDPSRTRVPEKGAFYWRYRNFRSKVFRWLPKASNRIIQWIKDRTVS